MSASASVLGPPARPVLAWLADVPAVTRNTRARGRTTAATGRAAGAGLRGPRAGPVLAWLADVPAVRRNTRARGRTTAATVVAASHLSTGCSQGHVPEVPPGAVIARCAARANGTRDQPVDVKSRHWRLVVISRKPLSTVVRQGKRTAPRPAARTRRQRRVRA